MSKDINFSKQGDFLLAQISDVVITLNRAQEILARIGEECSRINCSKVLLDEMSVEKREIPSHKILKLSLEMAKKGLTKIHMAFWCQPHLINKDAKYLSMYTYTNEYVVKHFSKKEEAIAWLDIQRDR